MVLNTSHLLTYLLTQMAHAHGNARNLALHLSRTFGECIGLRASCKRRTDVLYYLSRRYRCTPPRVNLTGYCRRLNTPVRHPSLRGRRHLLRGIRHIISRAEKQRTSSVSRQPSETQPSLLLNVNRKPRSEESSNHRKKTK